MCYTLQVIFFRKHYRIFLWEKYYFLVFYLPEMIHFVSKIKNNVHFSPNSKTSYPFNTRIKFAFAILILISSWDIYNNRDINYELASKLNVNLTWNTHHCHQLESRETFYKPLNRTRLNEASQTSLEPWWLFKELFNAFVTNRAT